MKKNILVFPCGSEIALEIHRSVKDSIHFYLIGASSVADHGKFVFDDYIENIPFITDTNCISYLAQIVKERKIDAIYPAMDLVIEVLKKHEKELGCIVIASSVKTTALCLSKKETYKTLSNTMQVPKLFEKKDIVEYPVFVKPDTGYGSRGAEKIHNKVELESAMQKNPNLLICEYISGEEFTVDCFTDKNKKLLYASARTRSRISNGISVHTKPVKDNESYFNLAKKIHEIIDFRGAWFFQLKKNAEGELVLLEIASRLGGSSALFRSLGINFALLSLYDAFDIPVSILQNSFDIELDRALNNRYKTNIEFDEVYIDYDDCIFSNDTGFNTDIMKFLFQCKNINIKITLISKHDGNLEKKLESQGIKKLFDRIIHLKNNEKKSNYIDNTNAIFIDDSFAERKEIFENKSIPVFSIDMIEVLIGD